MAGAGSYTINRNDFTFPQCISNIEASGFLFPTTYTFSECPNDSNTTEDAAKYRKLARVNELASQYCSAFTWTASPQTLKYLTNGKYIGDGTCPPPDPTSQGLNDVEKETQQPPNQNNSSYRQPKKPRSLADTRPDLIGVYVKPTPAPAPGPAPAPAPGPAPAPAPGPAPAPAPGPAPAPAPGPAPAPWPPPPKKGKCPPIRTTTWEPYDLTIAAKKRNHDGTNKFFVTPKDQLGAGLDTDDTDISFGYNVAYSNAEQPKMKMRTWSVDDNGRLYVNFKLKDGWTAQLSSLPMFFDGRMRSGPVGDVGYYFTELDSKGNIKKYKATISVICSIENIYDAATGESLLEQMVQAGGKADVWLEDFFKNPPTGNEATVGRIQTIVNDIRLALSERGPDCKPKTSPSPSPAPSPAPVPAPEGEIERLVFEDVVIEPFKLEDIKSIESGIVAKSIEYPKVIIDYLDIEFPIDPNSTIEGITINDAPFTIQEKNIPGPGKPDVINDVVFPPQKIYGPEIELKDKEGKIIPIKLEYLEYPSVVIDTVNIPDPPPADLFLQPIVITEPKKVPGIILDKPKILSDEEMEVSSSYKVDNVEIKDLVLPPEITFYPWDFGVEAHPEITIRLEDAPFTLEIPSVVISKDPKEELIIDNMKTSPIIINTAKTDNPDNSETAKLIPDKKMEIKLKGVNIDLAKNILERLKNKKRKVPKIEIKDVTVPVIIKEVEVPKKSLEKIEKQKTEKKKKESTKNENPSRPPGDRTEPSTEEKKKVDEVKGTITEKQRETMKKSLAQRESGNKCGSINKYGFVGKYQFGAAALIDLGMVKRTANSNGALRNPSSWTGKYGITSLQEFINNCAIQDKVFEDWSKLLEKRLRKQGIIDDNTTSSDITGYITTSHLLGTGGAKKLKQGIVGKDANGTTATEYFNIGKKAGYGQQYVGGKVNKFINTNKTDNPNPAPAPAPTPAPDTIEGTDNPEIVSTPSSLKKANVEKKGPIRVSANDAVVVTAAKPTDSEKIKLEDAIARQNQEQKEAEKSQGGAKKKGEPDPEKKEQKKIEVTNKSWPIPSSTSVSKNREIPVSQFGELRPKTMQGSNHPGNIIHGRKTDTTFPTFHYWLNPFVWDTKWTGNSWDADKANRPARIGSDGGPGVTKWYPWGQDSTFLNPTYPGYTEGNYTRMMNDPQFNRWQDWQKLYKKPQPAIWKSGNGFMYGELSYAFNANWDTLVNKFRINAYGLTDIPLSDEWKSKLSMMDVGIIMNFQQSGIVNRYLVGIRNKVPPPAASGTEQHLMMISELVANWTIGKVGKDSMIGRFLPSSKGPNLNWAHEPHWCGIFSYFVAKHSGHTNFPSPIQVSGYERRRLMAGLPLNRPRLEDDPNEEWDQDLWQQVASACSEGGSMSGYATHTPWLMGMAKHPDNPEHLWDSQYINDYKNQINQIWFVENIHYVKKNKNSGYLTEWGKRLILGAIDQNIIDWSAAFATTYGHVEVCVGLDLDGTIYLFGGNSGGEGGDGVAGNKMGFWSKSIAGWPPGIKAKNPWTGEGYSGGGHLCLSRLQGGNERRYHKGISAPWNNSPVIETYRNYLQNNPDSKFPVYKTFLDRLMAINTIDLGLGLEVSTDFLF